MLRSLLRLRQELTKLITRHTESISDDVAKATKQSAMYEVLLQGLNVGYSPGMFRVYLLRAFPCSERDTSEYAH